MTSKECETQLKELVEAWDLDETLLNQTDIEAIKHLLLENQVQHDKIVEYIKKNNELQQENKQLKEVIEEVRERLEYYLIGNMKYEDSQKEFKKLLQILDKAKENK